jgi:hypothetical protein
MSYRFRFGRSRGEVALVVQNAGDEYEDYNSAREMETRDYVSVKVDF